MSQAFVQGRRWHAAPCFEIDVLIWLPLLPYVAIAEYYLALVPILELFSALCVALSAWLLALPIYLESEPL